jgi:hypothetical protein
MNDQAEGCHNVENDEIMTLVTDTSGVGNSPAWTACGAGAGEMDSGVTCPASTILRKEQEAETLAIAMLVSGKS